MPIRPPQLDDRTHPVLRMFRARGVRRGGGGLASLLLRPLAVIGAVIGTVLVALLMAVLVIATLGIGFVLVRRLTRRPKPLKLSRDRSYAEVVEALPLVLGAALLVAACAGTAEAKLLVPMDDVQADHLK